MLEQMRKHMNWIMWTILVLIIVTFLFFGIYPAGNSRGIAASVNDDVITVGELNRSYRNMIEMYRQIFRDQFNDAMAKNLRAQALRDLVRDRLLTQEAQRIGLLVSDDEVRAAIMNVPAFSPNGKFDRVAYERYLDYVNMKPSLFEESQRASLLRRKLERIIEDGIDVTDEEVKASYTSKNPKSKPGDFEKNKASLRQSLLAEKRRAALDAFVRGLERKAKIKTYEEALEL